MDSNTIIKELQEDLKELSKAVNDLNLTMAKQEVLVESKLGGINSDIEYIKTELNNLHISIKEKENRASNRVFDLFKMVLPWIAVGLLTYFNVKH